MSKLFITALAKANAKGITPKSRESINWFRQYVRSNTKNRITYEDLNRELGKGQTKRSSNKFTLGSMYTFAYDALNKKTLPYWDAMPLIIPIQDDGNSILGINFHYLPLQYRAKLLDALYSYLTDEKLSDTTKLKMTYQTLQAAAAFKYIKPCIKRYLKSHVRTKLIKIPPQYWEVALFLPTAQWQNERSSVVYKDSVAQINARKP